MGDTNTIIGATIKIDTGNSNAAIQSVNKELNEVRGNLSATGSAASATSKAIGDSGGSFGKLKEQMSALPGPLGQAGEGVGKLSSAFKALLANPVVLVITAIVAALTLLYKAFTNSFEGGEKMEQVFAGIKAAAQALFDSLGHIASAIVKFFKFDFSGARDEIRQVANAVQDAYSKMSELTKQAQGLAREQATNDLEQAKRQAKLADLRAQAYDDSIPIAKRKAALLQLQKESEQNAKEDMDLAKRVADNKIAQLELEKDGHRKNFIEITKIQADEVRNATENSNELKQIGRQITAATRQELAEQKAAHDKALAEAKARRQELVDFTNKLAKIQQDTTLAGIKDEYEKEKLQLENKIADDKRANDLAFQDKKITRKQYDELNLALDAQAAAQRGALQDKHNKDVETKEAAFQKDLQGILAKIKADGEVSARAVEKAKLEADHAQQLAEAAKNYKDDALKFQAIKNALDEQLRADQKKLDEKYRLEDAKERLKLETEHQKKVITDTKARTSDRLKAVDAEQALFKKAFDDKVITELEYNTQVDQLAKDRQTIREEEQKNAERVAGAISQTFGNLAQLAGKQTALGKAFAIVQTTIDTYSSAIKAYKAMADIPVVGPALGIVAAAAAIAQGVEAVKNIVAVQVPGGESAGTTAAPALQLAAAPVAPTQQSTAINQSSINSIGDATSGRAYVLDADIQNNRERNERLNRAARLGG
jgi:hypothetical protein